MTKTDSYYITKRPRKEYVIDFKRSLSAFIGDVYSSEFSESDSGKVLLYHLKGLAYGLERNFPYLRNEDA